MSADLRDIAPTTDAELALFRAMATDARVVWCPLRHHQIDLVICSRLQPDYRRRCFRADCPQLDSCASERLQRAREGKV